MDKVISRGISFEQFYHSTKALIENSKNLDFDCGFLKPKDFKNFCSLLEIDFKDLCDEYYEFVLIKDYPKIILNNRLSLNITQFENYKEELTLEEKLCLLNHSNNITWKQISLAEVLSRTIFLNITTPVDFQLFLNRNKVAILVNGKVQGKLIIK